MFCTVIWPPLATPGTKDSKVSVSAMSPWSTNCNTAVAVYDFVMLAIRTWSDGRNGALVARSAVPEAALCGLVELIAAAEDDDALGDVEVDAAPDCPAPEHPARNAPSPSTPPTLNACRRVSWREKGFGLADIPTVCGTAPHSVDGRCRDAGEHAVTGVDSAGAANVVRQGTEGEIAVRSSETKSTSSSASLK